MTNAASRYSGSAKPFRTTVLPTNRSNTTSVITQVAAPSSSAASRPRTATSSTARSTHLTARPALAVTVVSATATAVRSVTKKADSPTSDSATTRPGWADGLAAIQPGVLMD